MKQLVALETVIIMAVLSGCASVKTKSYDATRLKAIDSWAVVFAYDTGEIEQTKKTEGTSEVKIVSRGQTPRDLQLRDDIFYMLQDDYAIPVKKNPAEATGKIQLHALDFSFGGFRQVTVTLVDDKGDALARLKVENGDRNATFKDDDSFARYAAKAIARTLKQP